MLGNGAARVRHLRLRDWNARLSPQVFRGMSVRFLCIHPKCEAERKLLAAREVSP